MRQQSARPLGHGWTRPALVVALGLACLLAPVVPNPEVRALAVLPFLVVGPGLALVGLLGVADGWRELSLAIGVSLAVDVLVMESFAYTGVHETDAPLAVLLGIALAGAAGQVLAGRPRPRGKETAP